MLKIPMPVKPKTQSFEGSLEFKWLWLDHNFKTMIDIGSNNGEFGNFLHGYFGLEHVIAFEPLERYHPQLKDLGFEVHPVALGNRDGVTAFTVNAEDASSSILPMSKQMKRSFPQLEETKTIEVPIRRLDGILEGQIYPDDLIIKIDAQGIEDEIIRGGAQTFRRAKAIIIEMSFVPMYDGQALFEEVHALLADLGHRFTGIKNQICTVSERRPLFAHCVYQQFPHRFLTANLARRSTAHERGLKAAETSAYDLTQMVNALRNAFDDFTEPNKTSRIAGEI